MQLHRTSKIANRLTHRKFRVSPLIFGLMLVLTIGCRDV